MVTDRQNLELVLLRTETLMMLFFHVIVIFAIHVDSLNEFKHPY